MDLTFFQLGELSFYGKKVFTILQKVFQLSLFYQNELSLNDIIGGTQQKYTFKTSNVSSNENIILQGLTCSWIIVQQLPEENEVLTWNKLIMSHLQNKWRLATFHFELRLFNWLTTEAVPEQHINILFLL